MPTRDLGERLDTLDRRLLREAGERAGALLSRRGTLLRGRGAPPERGRASALVSAAGGEGSGGTGQALGFGEGLFLPLS